MDIVVWITIVYAKYIPKPNGIISLQLVSSSSTTITISHSSSVSYDVIDASSTSSYMRLLYLEELFLLIKFLLLLIQTTYTLQIKVNCIFVIYFLLKLICINNPCELYLMVHVSLKMTLPRQVSFNLCCFRDPSLIKWKIFWYM